jgi:hypothetical protein
MMIDEIKHFMHGVLIQDAEVLKRIDLAADDVFIKDEQLIFSLSGLYSLLGEASGIDFGAFKKQLYGSTLNRELKTMGGEITVFQSSGKIDSSLYCLKLL